MPDYLTPGVYVEEVPRGANPIQGVDTGIAAFLGPARYGPIFSAPPLCESVSDFERIFGDGLDLNLGPGSSKPNYLWQSVRAFFAEGGQRLYVSRIHRPLGGGAYRLPAASLIQDLTPVMSGGRYHDGHARGWVRPTPMETGLALLLRARFPGEAGNMDFSLHFHHSPNRLSGTPAQPQLSGLSPHDLVLMDDVQGGHALLAQAVHHATSASWSFVPLQGRPIPLAALDPTVRRIRVITADVALNTPSSRPLIWPALPLDPRHATPGGKDSLLARFARRPPGTQSHLEPPVEILAGKGIKAGLDLIELLARLTPGLAAGLLAPDDAQALLRFECRLTGGNDGLPPTPADYAGRTRPGSSGLKSLETRPDIAIVAAPAAPKGALPPLIRHCESQRYRVAILDSGPGQSMDEVSTLAASFNSSHAALYYPWVLGPDARTGQPIPLPPCGFIAGIYARTDSTRGVWKAPAGEPLISATGLETNIDKSQQDVLNPQGINCLREFPGRGRLVWGNRTLSTDPEWKYVSVRRYCNYLEHSIEAGLHWVVFEPSDEPLWARARGAVEGFLVAQWRAGALQGDRPEHAFFVRCDRSTMTQNDLDNGRLVCLVGVALLKPAEFVVFRIGQWTAGAKA